MKNGHALGCRCINHLDNHQLSMIRCSKSPTHLAATAEGSIGVILKAQAKEESIFLETDPTG